jgi:NADH dehydrogenase FAD-containing subunit
VRARRRGDRRRQEDRTLAPGFLPHAHELHFDHLVLALGTVTDFRGLKGLHENAMPFKNLDDALRVRACVRARRARARDVVPRCRGLMTSRLPDTTP